LILMLLFCCTQLGASPRGDGPDDALDEALALVGMRRADLGWEPKGWWPRFPVAPYKLRAFDALFAAPLDSITFTRALAATAWEKLDPAGLDARDDRESGNLFQAVQRLGIDPKFGGFRGYTANVIAPATDLDAAILEFTKMSHRPVRIHTFGMDLPYPKPKEELARRVEVLPEGVGPILGRLVLNIGEAHRWAELAFRKVDGGDRMVVARRYNVGEEMVDAFDYCPAIDDVAATFDEASLWYAAQKCVQALDDARIALGDLDLGGVPHFAFDWETPHGWVRVRGGGTDTVDGTDALLIVDLGGNDTYTGGVAASTADRPLGLLLDMGGDDTYASDVPAQGAGLAGVGVLLDARESGNSAWGCAPIWMATTSTSTSTAGRGAATSGSACSWTRPVATSTRSTPTGRGSGVCPGWGSWRTGPEMTPIPLSASTRSPAGRRTTHRVWTWGSPTPRGAGWDAAATGPTVTRGPAAWGRCSTEAATTSTRRATGRWEPGTGSASASFTTVRETTSTTASPTRRGPGRTSAWAC
jgi:hypothetical protein